MALVVFSIGTDFRDYSTQSAYEADLDNAGLYNSGDDSRGEMYNDSDFDETLLHNGGGVIGLASSTITPADGEAHTGTAGTGVRVLVSASNTNPVAIPNDAVPVTYSYVEIDMNGFFPTNASIYCVTTTLNVSIFGNLLHGTDGTKTSTRSYINVNAADVFVIANNFMYTSAADSIRFNIAVANPVNSALIANNTGWAGGQNQTGINAANQNGFSLFNNLILGTFDAPPDGCYEAINGSTPNSNNTASDTTATGTDPVNNAVPADYLTSTVDGAEDLHLLPTAPAIGDALDLGTTPPGIQFDIDGQDRTGKAWDRGADQATAVGPPEVEIGTATENDKAYPFSASPEIPLGLASESDRAYGFTGAEEGEATVGTANESDRAYSFVAESTEATIGVAREADRAYSFSALAGSAGLVQIKDASISGPFAPAWIDGP